MANAHRPNLCLTSSPLCSCASTPFPTSSLSFVSLPSADLPQRELWLSFSSYCISQVDFHSAPILLISGFSLSQFTPLTTHPSLSFIPLLITLSPIPQSFSSLHCLRLTLSLLSPKLSPSFYSSSPSPSLPSSSLLHSRSILLSSNSLFFSSSFQISSVLTPRAPSIQATVASLMRRIYG